MEPINRVTLSSPLGRLGGMKQRLDLQLKTCAVNMVEEPRLWAVKRGVEEMKHGARLDHEGLMD